MAASSMECGDKRKTASQHDLIDDEEDDSMECSICSENWTESGPHRLVSLKCGHLYGEKCIERWIFKSRGPKAHCPHCKRQINNNDIRPVYPIRIAVQDTSELEFIKHQLATTKATLIERQHQLNKSLLALSMSNRELERLKAKAKRRSASSTIQLSDYGPDSSSEPLKTLQHFRTEFLPSADVYTRVMALHQERKSVFVSTRKGNDYGVDLFSLERPGHIAFLRMHSGAIRDIKCRDDQILTCGHDKSIKLTSLKDQKLMRRIPLESPGWSCSFGSGTTSSLLYCGLANDTTMVYDLRNTATPLHRLQNRQKTGGSPISSIIPMSINEKPIILCGNLNNIYAWNFDPTSISSPSATLTTTIENEPQCHIFDLEPLGVIDYKPYSLTMDDSDGTLLISLRRHNSSKHSIGLITENLTIDALHTFGIPYEQKHAHRTLHYRQNDRFFVCYSDDDKGNLCLRDDTGETKYYGIGERIFDIRQCTPLGGNNMVAALTSTKLHLYKYM
ncbi:hypothetical protein BCR42DRAFT_64354 [Absidia repens]|uniref:RING-type E3 ubiquitin transferase n=1 Tax=Absidia repens TaxID=90262 RepID=A0A1X2IDL9_9FUNG|nr:hypothetical protein BCR42DRAFT_64354 [Absidia repens]